MFDVLVIGGGPAGMMAAIKANRNNKKVGLIERNEELGKKLLISGGGRCNITNLKPNSEFMQGISDRFLYKALGMFNPYDIVDFFESRGVKLVEEDNNRMFPESGNSRDILNCLLNELKGIDIVTETAVKVAKEGFGFKVTTNKSEHTTKVLVIAAGGMSYPKLGSTGDGYEFAKSLGHKIVDTYPMNTPLVSNDSFIQSKVLQGLTLSDCVIKYKKNSYRGGMIFTHFGISGPIVLNISKDVHFGIKDNSSVFLDLTPDINVEDLSNLYLREGKKGLSTHLPKRLVEFLTEKFKVNKNPEEVSKKNFNAFIESIKNFEIKVASLKGYDNAFITGGGVSLYDVNPKTMESKVVYNLYLVGEVLDLSGITGGYNHTIALTTGFVAGDSI